MPYFVLHINIHYFNLFFNQRRIGWVFRIGRRKMDRVKRMNTTKRIIATTVAIIGSNVQNKYTIAMSRAIWTAKLKKLLFIGFKII